MNKKHILLFFTSLFLLCGFFSFSQQKDSIVIKQKYGLRVGIDLANPIITLIDNKRKGLEIVGDYRLSQKWYAAAELGYLQNETDVDYLNFTTDGQYIKIGADYNAYENWLDMDNLIYIGVRYGFSNFSQTLNSGIVPSSNPLFPDQPVEAPIEYTGLTAHWAEAVVGLKAEVINNLFVGFSLSGKVLLTSKQPDNFKNMFAPGFNRIFLSKTGFGFNYTVSYLIPIYKKEK